MFLDTVFAGSEERGVGGPVPVGLGGKAGSELDRRPLEGFRVGELGSHVHLGHI